ncbi:MAG TPA: ImmA/IrrE family metallo-endopeptidase, partial [Candidatus Limnocylindrales bacterium]
IFVNSQAQFVRQRFTAAHELGHHRLHGDRAFVESTLEEPDDWEANCFAEAFLVDPVGVRELLANEEHDVPRMVATTCEAYWVSPSAAGIILRHFDLIEQPELDRLLGELWSYSTLLRKHGLAPRPEPRPGANDLPRQFRERVLRLVKTGQLAIERAAPMLGLDAAALSSESEIVEPDPLGPGVLAHFPESLD